MAIQSNMNLLGVDYSDANALWKQSVDQLSTSGDKFRKQMNVNQEKLDNQVLGYVNQLAYKHGLDSPEFEQGVQQVLANNPRHNLDMGTIFANALETRGTGLEVQKAGGLLADVAVRNQLAPLLAKDNLSPEEQQQVSQLLGSLQATDATADVLGMSKHHDVNKLERVKTALTGLSAGMQGSNVMYESPESSTSLYNTALSMLTTNPQMFTSYGGAPGTGGVAGGLFPSAPNPQTQTSGSSSGFGALIQRGESGAAAYNAVNYGSGKGSGQLDTSNMTVGEIVNQMQSGKIAAIGRYQFNVGSFPEAVKKLGIDPNARLTPELQDQILASWYAGDKRPDIRNYITGKSSDVNKAITATSAEWRAVQNVNGKIYKEDGHNKATIAPNDTAATLQKSRNAYAVATQKHGMSPDEAYRIALLNPDSILQGLGGNISQGSSNTATSNPSSYTSKSDKELIGTSKVISNNSNYSALAKRSSDLIRLMGHHLDRSGKVINNDDKFKKYSKEYAAIKSSMKEELGKDFPEWEKVTKAMWTNAFKNMDARAAKEKVGATSTGSSTPSVPQVQSPFKVSQWDEQVSGKALQSRLKIKQNESVANGSVARPTAQFAEIVQGQLGDRLKYFSAFNDTYHTGTNSKHAKGTAFDVVLKDGTSKQEAAMTAQSIRQTAAAAGFNVKILDEYNNPSARSTGGHLHITVEGMGRGGYSSPGDYMNGMTLQDAMAIIGSGPPRPQKMAIDTRAFDLVADQLGLDPNDPLIKSFKQYADIGASRGAEIANFNQQMMDYQQGRADRAAMVNSYLSTASSNKVKVDAQIEAELQDQAKLQQVQQAFSGGLTGFMGEKRAKEFVEYVKSYRNLSKDEFYAASAAEQLTMLKHFATQQTGFDKKATAADDKAQLDGVLTFNEIVPTLSEKAKDIASSRLGKDPSTSDYTNELNRVKTVERAITNILKEIQETGGEGAYNAIQGGITEAILEEVVNKSIEDMNTQALDTKANQGWIQGLLSGHVGFKSNGTLTDAEFGKLHNIVKTNLVTAANNYKKQNTAALNSAINQEAATPDLRSIQDLLNTISISN